MKRIIMDQKTHKITKLLSLILILLIALGIFAGCTQNEKSDTITKLDELKGKPIAYLMGASYDREIESRFPDSEILSFNTFSEMIQALKSERIEAYFVDDPIGRQQLKETDGVNLVGEPLIKEQYGEIFNKDNSKLPEEFNTVIQKFSKDGTLKSLQDKWITGNGDDNLKFDDSIPAHNGVIEVAVEVDSIPFVYVSGESIIGYEVELLYLICAELGYKPHLTAYPFSALLPAVVSGRADVGISCITYTEERAETLLFTDSVYDGGPVAMVREKITERVL